MILHASSTGTLTLGARAWRCAVGRGGLRAAADKREGDGATPCGLWPLRRVLHRCDRVPVLASRLPVSAIARNDGWCDDPGDRAYNMAVKLPYPASCEAMWREDGLYDVVVVLGHNDAPPRPGAGSAIFLHCAAPGFSPTEGCVALDRDALVDILGDCGPGDALAVS